MSRPPSSEAARFTVIDVSGPARMLRLLRWSDLVLVVSCGFGVLGLLPGFLKMLYEQDWSASIFVAATLAVFAFASYTGWRHVGTIDPRVWRQYLLVFPLLAALVVFIGIIQVPAWLAKGAGMLSDVDALASLYGALVYVGVAIPGFVSVLALLRARIGAAGVRLEDLLLGLSRQGGRAATRLAGHDRVSVRKGIAFGLIGATILIATTFAPLPTEGRAGMNALRFSEQLNLLAFFLILRARRYFQVNADALLAVDKRRPILFLRSFADDEQGRFKDVTRALLDFSLETRLANHFHHFGPFIAIGSPKDSVPQLGAARALLRDDEWQGRVLRWMQDARVIIMYCGTTQWVNWELRQVIKTGSATRLILMFPESKGWRAARRRENIETRVAQIRSAFEGTPWKEEVAEYSDFSGARAMLFRADGSMLMVKSRSRARDAYHLAALIAHQRLLERGGQAEMVVPRRSISRTKVALIGGGAFAGLAAAIGLALLLVAASPDLQLDFGQGQLLYSLPVKSEEAKRVGDLLLQEQIFSAEHPATVQLHRDRDRYQLRFVIRPQFAQDPLTAIRYGVLGRKIGDEVLRGTPVEVTLSDERLQPIRVIPLSARMEFGQGELYYSEPVTVADAQAIGSTLLQLGIFDGSKRRSAHVGLEAGVFQVSFVVDPSRSGDPKVAEMFREVMRGIADALGDRGAVVVHLCDDRFRSLHRETL